MSFFLHNPGLGQNEFTREKHGNLQENCQKVGQNIKKAQKNHKIDEIFP